MPAQIRPFIKSIKINRWIALVFACWTLSALGHETLATQFSHPPASARPWVYWFWNNANVTKVGITADLEAMRRAGVGGVIIMDVFERFAPPRGTAEFMNDEWRELFRFAVAEAARLGLEINMTNGPGWCGSSGPWITPELSMQMLVSTNLTISGPASFSAPLPKPPGSIRAHDEFDSSIKFADFYHDIAVLAYPSTPDGIIAPTAVVNLTSNLDASGNLRWKIPSGAWIIQRIGHRSTGSSTRPPVAGGNGLECDKLSATAMDVHFMAMMNRLITNSTPAERKALTATHIDSWEVGSQSWTPNLRHEFLKRRGYDPIIFLPNVLESATGQAVGNTLGSTHFIIGDNETAARFRWDFEQTRAELLAENYVGKLATLAHQHGMRLTIEGYDLPFGDESTYTARSDEPMSEFWTHSTAPVTLRKGIQMASVGHIYGHTVIGAEAFTSGDDEKWMLHPASIKSLGDYEFCQGINRFVIHRYAHQPYLDRAPGATMGPWGLHYERTQTWWEMSQGWHEYLARCQFMLRAGRFVADLCYLRPESGRQSYFTPTPTPPAGYKYDECSAEALMTRFTVKHGRLVLPDGMSYRALVLPKVNSMTPKLARKLRQLVRDGATVLVNGSAPAKSPSLADLPQGDAEVARLTAEFWGDCDGIHVTEHHLGRGNVIWGQTLPHALSRLDTPPDFVSGSKLNWIHRRADDTEIYFVANPAEVSIEASCEFRVPGLEPEVWNPETGEVRAVSVYQVTPQSVSIPIAFEPSGSTFVVFRHSRHAISPIISFTRNGDSIFAAAKPAVLQIQSATYGVPGDTARTRDVRARLQSMLDQGISEFQVAELAQGDDPAYGVVKTLRVEVTLYGKPTTMSGQDPETFRLNGSRGAAERPAELRRGLHGESTILAREPGHYEAKTANGQVLQADVAAVSGATELGGPWAVQFPAHQGAPDKITLDHLTSLSDSVIPGVRFFSGTATYTKEFDWNSSTDVRAPIWLDLGRVEVMARLKLNGQDLGILWKPPYRVDIAPVVKSGHNTLEIQVADLWPNRLIGDAALPATERLTWSSWEPFHADSPLSKSGLLGPVTIQSVVVISPR